MAEQISRNIVKIINEIIYDEDLVKLVSSNSESPFDTNVEVPAANLMNKRIFPYPFDPKPKQEKSTQIRVFSNRINFSTYSLEFPSIQVDVLLSKELWIINDKNGNRTLRPLEIIDILREKFNGKDVCGVGKLNFRDAVYYNWNEEFNGYILIGDLITKNGMNKRK